MGLSLGHEKATDIQHITQWLPIMQYPQRESSVRGLEEYRVRRALSRGLPDRKDRREYQARRVHPAVYWGRKGTRDRPVVKATKENRVSEESKDLKVTSDPQESGSPDRPDLQAIKGSEGSQDPWVRLAHKAFEVFVGSKARKVNEATLELSVPPGQEGFKVRVDFRVSHPSLWQPSSDVSTPSKPS